MDPGLRPLVAVVFVGGFVLVVHDLADSRHWSFWQHGVLGLLAVSSFPVSALSWSWADVWFFIFDPLLSSLVYLP